MDHDRLARQAGRRSKSGCHRNVLWARVRFMLRWALRRSAKGLASLVGVLLLLTCLSFQSKLPETTAPTDQSSVANSSYVGSRVCAKCHGSIYRSFSRTDMGRSMSEITPALLERIPNSASIFDPKLNRHFELVARDNNLYQSEYETAADG